jgi:hypothetical protein
MCGSNTTGDHCLSIVPSHGNVYKIELLNKNTILEATILNFNGLSIFPVGTPQTYHYVMIPLTVRNGKPIRFTVIH